MKIIVTRQFEAKQAGAIWETPRRQYEGREPWDEVKAQDPVWEAQQQAARRRGDEWQREAGRAISLGELPYDKASELGYSLPRRQGYAPLPNKIYHVTTSKTAVLRDGLKTRDELATGKGAGLGGGDSDTISFTTDFNIAMGIYDSLLEANQVCRGDFSISQMIQEAKEGQGAPRPWLDAIIQHYVGHRDPKTGYPEELVQDLKGIVVDGFALFKTEEERNAKQGKDDPPGAHWRPYGEPLDSRVPPRYAKWQRPMTPEERLETKMKFFKNWSVFREAAGGPLDPTYFLSDPHKLAKVPPAEIAIVVCQPLPRAMGFEVSGLGEWRTHTGQAIKIVDVLQPQAKKRWAQ